MRRITVLLLIALVASLPAAPAFAARKVVIRGGGWGHGIGMSQYGSLGRAKAGHSAERILEHYYTDTAVQRRKMPPNVRIGLLQYQTVIEVDPNVGPGGASTGEIRFKVHDNDEVIARGGPASRWRLEVSGTGGVRLYKNGNKVKHGGRTVFGSTSRPVIAHFEDFGTILRVVDKGMDYRFGRMSFGTHRSTSCGPGYCLRLVNVLPMQPYIYGLGEVPSSWPGAVLEAQAIAARTYAFKKVLAGQHRIGCDCALYDTPADQVFSGDEKRTGSGIYWVNWKRAVDNTNGRVVLYDGAPIDALYSSSSGGWTENNENVWGSTPLPFLRGVRDSFDNTPENPNHTWRVEMSWEAFSSRLSSYYGTGSVRNFAVVAPRGVSGRVTVDRGSTGGVRIRGASRTVRTSGWSVRSALGLKDTLFRVEVVILVGERFRSRYDSLDGAPGKATSEPYSVPKGASTSLGQAQDFKVGRMTWRKATGKVVWQRGPVLTKYDALGREKSSLGMPKSSIWGPGPWRAGTYVNGRIFTSDLGTHAVVGSFETVHRRNGGGDGFLGVPRAARQKSASLPGGARQRFKAGTLYRTPSKDVWALWGKIDVRYRALGQATSACGYPTGDQTGTASAGEARFQHGTMTWTASGVNVECSSS